jgi:hypothetical protein
MKKLLTIAALAGATSLSFGQGYVSFFNSSSTRFSTNSAAGQAFVTATAKPIGSYYFALFAAPSTQNTISTSVDPTLNGWTYVGIATNTAQGGRLDGNNFDTTGGSFNAMQTPGFAGGSTADFAIAGWSSSIGTTWAQAQAWWANGTHAGSASVGGSFGIAPTVGNDVVVAAAGGPYNNPFGTTAGTINGFGLNYYPAIPEPTGFALAGLGAAAMLIFRRRKQ